MRFSTTGKLAPCFIGPFSITERIGPVAYRVSLPAHLSGIHDVFHVLQLRKCLRESDSAITSPDLQELEVSPDLSIVQQPIRVLDTEVRHLQNKDVPLIKIQWSANPNDLLGKPESISSDLIRVFYLCLAMVSISFHLELIFFSFECCLYVVVTNIVSRNCGDAIL